MYSIREKQKLIKMMGKEQEVKIIQKVVILLDLLMHDSGSLSLNWLMAELARDIREYFETEIGDISEIYNKQ